MPKGEANKLSKEEILQRAAGGMKTGKIMEMTGRARSTVIRAVKGKLTPGAAISGMRLTVSAATIGSLAKNRGGG